MPRCCHVMFNCACALSLYSHMLLHDWLCLASFVKRLLKKYSRQSSDYRFEFYFPQVLVFVMAQLRRLLMEQRYSSGRVTMSLLHVQMTSSDMEEITRRL